MPQKKSAFKRLKTNEKQRLRNKARRSSMKSMEKKLRKAVDASDKENVQQLAIEATKAVDKAVKVGLIHRNKANRKKAQFAKLVNELA
jgi:small subunit ribosomal protein S20